AIDQARVGHRLRAREDDEDLVEVGDDHVLLPGAAWTRLAAAEAALPSLDRLDHRVPALNHGQRHPVADHDQVRVAAILLHAAAKSTLDQGLSVSEHGVEPAPGAQHGAGEDGRSSVTRG